MRWSPSSGRRAEKTRVVRSPSPLASSPSPRRTVVALALARAAPSPAPPARSLKRRHGYRVEVNVPLRDVHELLYHGRGVREEGLRRRRAVVH